MNDANVFIVPTIGDVVDFATSHGISESLAQEFFQYYEKNGWKTANGMMLTSWEGVICNWNKRRAWYRNAMCDETVNTHKTKQSNEELDEIEFLRIENERLKSGYEKVRAERDDARRVLRTLHACILEVMTNDERSSS